MQKARKLDAWFPVSFLVQQENLQHLPSSFQYHTNMASNFATELLSTLSTSQKLEVFHELLENFGDSEVCFVYCRECLSYEISASPQSIENICGECIVCGVTKCGKKCLANVIFGCKKCIKEPKDVCKKCISMDPGKYILIEDKWHDGRGNVTDYSYYIVKCTDCK